MTQAMNTRSFDTVAVRLTIECMEDQKEQLRVLLSALNDMDEVRELTPNVTTLLTLAQHIAEDHKHWSCLKEHLGLRVRTEGARCAAPHPTQQLDAAVRGRALYTRLYDEVKKERDELNARVTEERIKHAQAVATLANVAHALETGTPPEVVLSLVRIALRISPGGQPL